METAWAYGPRPRSRRRSKARVLGAVVGFVVAASVTAYAIWSVTSDGPGFAKSGALEAPTYAEIASAELVGDMFPGETGDMRLRVTNPNSVPLQLTNAGSGLAIAVDQAGCEPSNFSTVVAMDATWLAANVPPIEANATTDVVLPDVVKLAADAPSQCQNARATFNVSVTFSTVS